MSTSKHTFIILSLIIFFFISSASGANHRWNLLEGIDPNPADFKEFEIGKRIVYWHPRTIGEAIVGGDEVIYYFDRETLEPVDVIVHWRDDLPDVLPELNVTKKQAESMVEGYVQFSNLYYISPESYVFSPIQPTPKNPCWVVASIDEGKEITITVVDAVEGKILGYGISPPSYTGFSLAGPYSDNPCTEAWNGYYKDGDRSARYWFDIMGYSTEAMKWPTEEKVKSHIQSDSTAMFYEIAHSRYTYGILFASGCDNGFYELTTADEIDDWISDYTKMPFAFIASCFGMCDVNEGTLSYAFMMGSERDTATVGYCCMSCQKCSNCWYSHALNWQRDLFEHLNDGNTVKEAFDLANQAHPACYNNECMRFAGDPNFAVVPIVPRVPPFPSLSIVDDVNDANCVEPWNFIDENYLTYEICYNADGNEANNVIIVDQLPFEVDYYSSDPCGVYDSNSHMVTWELNDLSATDSGCIQLIVKVNMFARPSSSFRNYCEIRNDQYSRNATEKTNVCCWVDIIYVDINAAGCGSGLSWYHADPNLQSALKKAQLWECNEIWVAKGTYHTHTDPGSQYRDISFELVDGVAMYGGFTGSETSCNQRNWTVNETILEGDIDNSGYSDTDYLVTAKDLSQQTIVDGFTIKTGAKAGIKIDNNSLVIRNNKIIESQYFSDDGYKKGYGIECINYSSATITNCLIQNNDTCGIYCNGGSYVITDCNISGNGKVYTIDGGGVHNYNCSTLTIERCTFRDNEGHWGGGLYNYYSSPVVKNCIFSGNYATEYAGGVYNLVVYSSAEFANNIFFDNKAEDSGGGMVDEDTSPKIVNCTFSKNSTGNSGGGIHNYWYSNPDIRNCIFWDNYAEVSGDEIDNYLSNPTVSYCDVQGGWPGSININVDPCFVDANANNYHLDVNSLCIDAGDPNFNPNPPETDIDGEPRLVNGRVDIGADEYYWSPADFDKDEIVNFIDYAMLAGAWQSSSGQPDYNDTFDLEDDDTIDYDDLALFCDDWLWESCWNRTMESIMMGRGMGGGMSQSMIESASLTEAVYSPVEVEQQQPEQITQLDIEEMLKWLAEVWLDPEVQEAIDEADWLKFIESLKSDLE